MSLQLLESIRKLMADEGMDCTIFDENENNPIPRLLLYLGQDNKHRDRNLEITADEQILPGNYENFENMKVESGFYRLQIQSEFPITFDSKHAADMASCVNYLNGMLELPCLIADEVNNKVFYRSVQLLSKQEARKELLTGIVGMHRMVLDIFVDLLERIGSGEMTYFQFLDEIVKYSTMEAKKLHA